MKWSAALGGALAVSGNLAFGLKKATGSMTSNSMSYEGKWIPSDCWADCGSKGFNKAYVVDGIVVKMGTDDTIPDSFDCPQLRSCARGRSQRLHILGADRLKYPMKRKHWAPGGGRKDLRGKDEWVRITWDEALDILASELKRIKENYGNSAILANKLGELSARPLGLFGGFTDQWSGHSGGSWQTAFLFGHDMQGWSDRYDLLNSKLIILWAMNPAWSQAGLPSYTFFQAKKAGVRFISIDPFYNPTAQVLADEWIPIRPATDHAMLLGMMHTLVEEDDPVENPLIDWDFLNRYTVGFDAEHMPKGVDPKENFRDYLLGLHDGQPKNAEWASEICGVPADRIRSLAREYAKTERASICASSAPARVDNSDSMPQAYMTLGAMTGHFGRSGSTVAVNMGHFGTNGGPRLVKGQNSRAHNKRFQRAPFIPNPHLGELAEKKFSFYRNIGQITGMAGGSNTGRQEGCINLSELNTAILKGKYTAGKGDIRKINIQMIYHGHGARMNQLPNTLDAIKAHRKVEFVVTQNMFFTTDAKYSDLVLPTTSKWEEYGNVCTGYREQLLWHSQVIEPYFESKPAIWISVELGKRLGLNPKDIQPWSWKQEILNEVADARVVKEDGKTYEPLVDITEQDLKDYGVEGVPQKGRIPIKKFQKDGIYHVPRKPDDNLGYVYLKDFYDDPEANPLWTPSGKLEIHCEDLADYVNSCGFTEIRSIPTYNPPLEGYEATFKDWKNKIKGEYPLQLFNLHHPRRAHSMFDNVCILREAFPHEFLMNPIDATSRGIKDGDIVLVWNKWGKILRPVWVTNLIMPGVTALGQGAWVELDEETGIDIAGCANVLKGPTPTGGGHVGWNSSNVEVEKWKGEPLLPDYMRKAGIPIMEEK
jgi:anaerobic dimethyl sulfoxide reductase subunit A